MQHQHRSLQQHIYASEHITQYADGGDFFKHLDAEFDIVADNGTSKSGSYDTMTHYINVHICSIWIR